MASEDTPLLPRLSALFQVNHLRRKHIHSYLTLFNQFIEKTRGPCFDKSGGRIISPHTPLAHTTCMDNIVPLDLFLDGFGGDGKESRQYCVQTGPFNESAWSHPAPENMKNIMDSIMDVTGQCQTPVSHGTHYKRCLRRSFNNVCPNVANVLQTIGIPCTDFKRFDNIVRENYHNDLHNEIGTVLFYILS